MTLPEIFAHGAHVPKLLYGAVVVVDRLHMLRRALRAEQPCLLLSLPFSTLSLVSSACAGRDAFVLGGRLHQEDAEEARVPCLS